MFVYLNMETNALAQVAIGKTRLKHRLTTAFHFGSNVALRSSEWVEALSSTAQLSTLVLSDLATRKQHMRQKTHQDYGRHGIADQLAVLAV